MRQEDRSRLLSDLAQAVVTNPGGIAIVGWTETALEVRTWLHAAGLAAQDLGVFDDVATPGADVSPIAAICGVDPKIIVVAEDAGKQRLLDRLAEVVPPGPKIIVGGYGHVAFTDPIFDKVLDGSVVPSLANGYPECRIHLYQCLANAARLGLSGTVVEFGMFRGGTTMLLSQFIEALGTSWPIIGFDTFDGFPPPRDVRDLYAHPGCVFRGEDAVRAMFASRNVRIVAGDLVETARQLVGERIVLAFLDTDNFTSATAALDAIQEGVQVGGAIVFDHFTARDRFVYTVGERMAARRLLDDPRYFNLHGTGVFMRQR
ncbi:MAG: TylF/MycF/NovP-related O-methyltransferase [Pseudomonadota bacterium]